MDPKVDSEDALHPGTEKVGRIEDLESFPILGVHGHFLTSLKAAAEVPNVVVDD